MKSASHLIYDIKYSEDWLLCLCGWEGKAYDLKGYALHKKEAPELETAIDYTQPYIGMFSASRQVNGK